MATKATKKIVETELTEEDLILGNAPTVTEKVIVDYESVERKYRVTNLMVKNKPITVTGNLIETFIGTKNRTAREELKGGAVRVTTKDLRGKDMYKIEVIV